MCNSKHASFFDPSYESRANSINFIYFTPDLSRLPRFQFEMSGSIAIVSTSKTMFQCTNHIYATFSPYLNMVLDLNGAYICFYYVQFELWINFWFSMSSLEMKLSATTSKDLDVFIVFPSAIQHVEIIRYRFQNRIHTLQEKKNWFVVVVRHICDGYNCRKWMIATVLQPS